MKKMILIAAMAVMAAFTNASGGFDVVGLKNFHNQDWRVGLGVPVFTCPKGAGALDLLVLTDQKPFGDLVRGFKGASASQVYLGAGLNVPVLKYRSFSLAGMVGWSANFTELSHVHDSSFGYGVGLNFKY